MSTGNHRAQRCIGTRITQTLNVISYVVNTKSSGKRNVLVLSTLNPILGLTKDDGKSKPAIIKLYDFAKGGTDIVDQIMGKHTDKPKSSTWTITAFLYILDVACVNASTLSRMSYQNKPTQRSKPFEFGWEIAMSLIRPQLQHRHTHSNGLQKYTQRAIRDLLRIKVEQPPSSPGKKKRCRTCLDEVEDPDHKKNKASLGKTVHRCIQCGQSLCTSHFQKICPSCFESKNLRTFVIYIYFCHEEK